jgi:toxin ParE1/3/4
MNILWSPEAIEDLDSLHAYISEDDSAAARRVVLRVIAAVERLSGHPHLGRPGRVPGTRELVVPDTPYIVPYRVRRNMLEVLRVYHSARRWPDQF